MELDKIRLRESHGVMLAASCLASLIRKRKWHMAYAAADDLDTRMAKLGLVPPPMPRVLASVSPIR